MSITLDLSRVSNAPAVKAPVNLSGLTRAGLRQALIDANVCPPEKAKMRASQVWSWIHHYGVTEFSAMSNVAKDMQAKLAEHFTLARPEVVERQVSKDGTRKWLIRTAPGIEIETVYIPDVGRAGALCVSSQVGCTLNCTFCHTGTQKLVRNLTAAEIVAQVQVARDDLGEWPSPKEDRRLSNIVFMGMGEPLYNLDNVADAIEVIADGDGVSISRRRITVSTSGVVPEIPRLGEKTSAMLAISQVSSIAVDPLTAESGRAPRTVRRGGSSGLGASSSTVSSRHSPAAAQRSKSGTSVSAKQAAENWPEASEKSARTKVPPLRVRALVMPSTSAAITAVPRPPGGAPASIRL